MTSVSLCANEHKKALAPSTMSRWNKISEACYCPVTLSQLKAYLVLRIYFQKTDGSLLNIPNTHTHTQRILQ